MAVFLVEGFNDSFMVVRMTFDNTITLGNIVVLLGFLGGLWMAVARTYHSLDKRAAIFEQIVTSHSSLLEQHTRRMERTDETLLTVMSELQRLVGRLDMLNPQTMAQAASAAMSVVRAAEGDALRTVAEAAAEAVAKLSAVRRQRDRRVTDQVKA